MEERNKWVEELKKYLNKEVTVTQATPTGIREIKGKCIALNFSHLNIMLETKKELILIKPFLEIKRKK